MKKMVRYLINQSGFDITRKPKTNFSNVYDNFPEESLLKRRFYNIGAGSFGHPNWTNIDYATEHYREHQKHPFINYNLMELKPLPIADDIAELVYSSYTIEHISDDAARNMLRESYRILKPGGGIRLITPSARLFFLAYKKKHIKYFYWVDGYSKPGSWEKFYKVPLSKASIHQLFLHYFAGQLCEIDIDNSPQKKYSDSEISEIFLNNPAVETLNFFTKQCKFNPKQPGNHINWWTHEKIISFLKEAGFSEPYIAGWGQSLFPPFLDTNLFEDAHFKISLCVEAIK
jgi:ubiquinone/menaquinone biosynthesis C-methylase UbiE